ncbi:hypothetical protein [uncultured Draconibacterium sp.]|uniref:hypothetical protein n=1 Tax=uncultured Draconibacterium sp. TaxID=1573823 RepID=UPI0032177DD4
MQNDVVIKEQKIDETKSKSSKRDYLKPEVTKIKMDDTNSMGVCEEAISTRPK